MKFRLPIVLRIAALGAFFLSTLWLTVGVGDVFPSPDEAANFRFATEVMTNRDLCIDDDTASVAGGIVHPRSTAVVGDCVVPGSFLGFPALAGVVGSWFGVWGILLLTPVLALLAVVSFWDILRRATRDIVLADIGAFLLMTSAPFWYYASRVMMHNVAFVAFLVVSVWFFVLAMNDRRRLTLFFSGLASGLAMFMRSFEAPWIIGLGIIALVASKQTRNVKDVAAWLVGAAIPVLCMVALQFATYGSPIATGYTVDGDGTASTSAASMGIDEASSAGQPHGVALAALLFPFGFHPWNIVRNAWSYGVVLYPWIAVLGVIGVVVALRTRGAWRAVAVASIVLGVWLIAVYGSWSFADNPDPRAITIGNSHVRYWLPLFVLGAAFSALALRRVQLFAASCRGASRATPPSPRRGWGWLEPSLTALLATLIVSAGLSTLLVFFAPDGLIATRAALPTFIAKRDAIVSSTPENAIIVVDRADKYLFPYRHVVVPLRDEATYAAMPELAAAAPLYYFGITFPQTDIDYLNLEKLAPLGLRIEFVQTMSEESLYRIVAL